MNKVLSIVVIIHALTVGKSLVGQSDFYSVQHIPEIRLYFAQSNWDELLDSLYSLGELARLGADVEIDGIRYEKVGVRYKGFSSYGSDRAKNPFNIDLDFIYQDQNHQGFAKIKLSNVIQDPSFLREVLSYEIARKYMPASRANYANLYVNDTLIGLYTNVEAVESTFLLDHFQSNDGAFIKCNPETVDLNGQNSNLSNSPGTDISAYYSLYNMKSSGDDDWDELYELIEILNNAPSEIGNYLNVDRTLWMHALNYALINFDSYVGYAQNYYIYKDVDGRFNPILWDLNMSFASYRFTDASDNWDGFNINEAKTIDPLQHLNSFSVHPRPLIRNLLENDTYKRMYLAHLRTIIEENIDSEWYSDRGAELQAIIDQSVQNDTNKFYSYQNFLDNIDTTVSDLIDYPGIKDLMTGRSEYLSAYPGFQGAPDISMIDVSPLNTSIGDDVFITAEISGNPLKVLLAYRLSENQAFSFIEMQDNGLFNDGTPGDGKYGAEITGISNDVAYYIYAENDSSGRFMPARAAYEFYTIESRLRPGDLVINEVLAQNNFDRTDESGAHEPWVELFNTTEFTLSTSDLYLRGDDENDVWSLPSVDMSPGAYLTLWMDGDSTESQYHSNFRIPEEDSHLFLTYADESAIDSMDYGEQESVASYGRFPNGSGSFVFMKPSYNAYNDGSDNPLISDAVFIYPNPANESVFFRINDEHSSSIRVYNSDGRQLSSTSSAGGETVEMNTSNWAPGVYLVHIILDNTEEVKKIMITH